MSTAENRFPTHLNHLSSKENQNFDFWGLVAFCDRLELADRAWVPPFSGCGRGTPRLMNPKDLSVLLGQTRPSVEEGLWWFPETGCMGVSKSCALPGTHALSGLSTPPAPQPKGRVQTAECRKIISPILLPVLLRAKLWMGSCLSIKMTEWVSGN